MTLAFDADLSARIEATYRTPDVVAQRRTILDVLDPRPGENALDIGSGPGLLAAQIAERVRPSGSVHGLDPSESMLALSAERAATAGVTLAAGVATELPYADSSFDIVTATQVYEYVPDMPAALAVLEAAADQSPLVGRRRRRDRSSSTSPRLSENAHTRTST
jgi:2-polyprenyl-3-methyl-5-hydroxy-6-metoxy-1,4-benzoquinol methylase